jgi:hypothetical protein
MRREDRFNVRGRALLGALLVSALFAGPPGVAAQQLDICGCANAASLGAFDTQNLAALPAGVVADQGSQYITLKVPEDGVFVFDSFLARPRASDSNYLQIFFAPNAKNTPVTILVKGDFTITTQTHIVLSGSNGSSGRAADSGKGGAGAPGGFRGGDGAYQFVNGAARGGAGLGPLGGAPGTASPLAEASGGQFLGNQELLPMIGGSGGGGGASSSSAYNCSGGGGGGGGGAILVMANGTVTIGSNGTNAYIAADGGDRASPSNTTCSSYGGSGSGGAIRIVANTITGGGNLYARPGTSGNGAGRIRLEAISNTLPGNNTNPLAIRTQVPGPVSAPVVPAVRVTRVGGVAAPALPTGNQGLVDITLPIPGSVSIDVATSAVPSGTTLEVYVKPRIGGDKTTLTTTLNSCSGDGSCTASVSTTLAAGTYTVEARATYQTP